MEQGPGIRRCPQDALRSAWRENILEAPDAPDGIEEPSREDEVALELISFGEPSCSARKAEALLNCRNSLIDLTEIVDIDEELLKDAMLERDRKDFLEMKEQCGQKYAKRKQARDSIKCIVKASYAETPLKKRAKPSEDPPKMPRVPSTREKWISTIKHDSDCLDFIRC